MAGTFIFLPPAGDGSAGYWGDAVADFAALPASGDVVGQVVLVLDSLTLYEWNGSAWTTLVDGPADVSGPASAVDSQIALFNGTSGKLIKAATGTGYVKGSSGVASFQAVPIPVADGGTNSTTALNNNRVMRSSGGAVVEASAITASRALASDANGIPTHATTTTTELNYVAGVTSAIQTQIDTKAAGAASSTDEAIARYDSTTGKVLQNSSVTVDDGGIMRFTATTAALKLPILTTTQRDLLVPEAGFVIYNSTTNRPQIYLGAPDSTWANLAGWGE